MDYNNRVNWMEWFHSLNIGANMYSYSIFHTAKCGMVRKIQDFKTYEGMKRAFDAAIKNPQKYSKYGDIAKITAYDSSMHPVAQITDILEK